MIWERPGLDRGVITSLGQLMELANTNLCTLPPSHLLEIKAGCQYGGTGRDVVARPALLPPLMSWAAEVPQVLMLRPCFPLHHSVPTASALGAAL